MKAEGPEKGVESEERESGREPEPMLEPVAATLEELRADWPALAEKCRIAQPLLRHLLMDSWPVSLNETTLVIGFDPEFHGELEQARGGDHAILRHLLGRELGRAVHVEFVLLKEPVRWSHQAPRDDGESVPDEQPFSPESAGVNPRAWMRNAAVRLVLETFNGDILDIQR